MFTVFVLLGGFAGGIAFCKTGALDALLAKISGK